MALGFKMGASGSSGAKVYLDNELMSPHPKEIKFKTVDSIYTLPHGFIGGASVSYNNKIYIIGGKTTSSDQYGTSGVYSWDGTTWKTEKNISWYAYHCCAVVYNNKIHVIGGSRVSDTSGSTNHYSWDGDSTHNWVKESTLPYSFISGCAVVYNNKIHIFGSGGASSDSNTKKHYSWDGSSWTKLTNLPMNVYGDCFAVVYNGEIHEIGGSWSNQHYIFNGSNWRSGTSPMGTASQGDGVVWNNEFHILNGTVHQKFNGTSWETVETLPYSFNDGCVENFEDSRFHEEKIHMLGGSTTSNNHCILDEKVIYDVSY